MSKTIDTLVTVRPRWLPTRTLTLGALISERLTYCPDTGKLTWRDAPGVRSNLVGTCPTVLNANGYFEIKIAGKTIPTHRLAFVLMTGNFPPDGMVVDHANGIRTDNRWCNLRLCTRAQNSQNKTGPAPKNTSGFRGVHWDKRFSKWKASIKVCGKRHNLGSFDSKEDAIAARLAASARLHGPFAGRHT